MAEPLKNYISRALLERTAAELYAVHPAFDTERWLSSIFDHDWEARALKERLSHVARALRPVLPHDLAEALAVVRRTVDRMVDHEGEKLTFEYLFFNDFVALYAIDHPDAAFSALETITRWTSAEFAIRPFLLRYPERTYAQMLHWSTHRSPMVRRLSSEGFRPRLPWGMGIPALKKDPSPILPVLENLKNDPSESVRRSVANNLNDIAKDHPERVLRLATQWYGHGAETDWIVRHACRGLLKKGHQEALAFFGFQKGVPGVHVNGLACDATVGIGDRLAFGFTAFNATDQTCRLRLEYAIHFRTQGGTTRPKTFFIKTTDLPPGAEQHVQRTHRFEDFTTRKHYPGPHRLAIVVNGQAVAEVGFTVVNA